MRGGLLLLGVAVLACAAAGLLLLGTATTGMATGGAALLTAAATLLLAATAAAFAWRALTRMHEMAGDLERLTRSVDAAVGELAASGDRDRAAIAELHDLVSRELGLPSRHAAAAGNRPGADAKDAEADPAPKPPAPAAAPQAPAAPSAVQAAASAPAAEPVAAAPPSTQAAAPVADASSAPSSSPPAPAETKRKDAALAAALKQVMATGRAEISLQPIVSVARGAARGFDVHVHVAPDLGPPTDLRRLGHAMSEGDAAAFERLVVLSAASEARRRPGRASEAMPLHAAISDAVLGRESELGSIVELFRRNPALTRSVVLSLPSWVAGPERQSALQRLAAVGVGLAVEGWEGGPGDMERLRKAGLRYLKLTVDRILDRPDSHNGEPAEALLDLAAANGVAIIATDIETDEEAVELLDLGIDLMTGPRFSGPRLLEPESRERAREAGAR